MKQIRITRTPRKRPQEAVREEYRDTAVIRAKRAAQRLARRK